MNPNQLAASWLELKKGSLWGAYLRANPIEAKLLEQYVFSIVGLSPTAVPTLKTHTGRGLAGIIAAMLTPAPATEWSVEEPRQPTEDISNPTGLGRNVQTRTNLQDLVCPGGTFDSAILIEHPASAGTTVDRIKLRKAASIGPGPGYGRHGIYCKAPNVTVADGDIQCDPSTRDTDSAISIRDAGFSGHRLILDALFALSIYDDNLAPGPILIEDAILIGHHAETAIWMDTPVPYDVTMRGVDFRPVPGAVCARGSATVVAPWLLESCTKWGQPLAATDFGFPSAQITFR